MSIRFISTVVVVFVVGVLVGISLPEASATCEGGPMGTKDWQVCDEKLAECTKQLDACEAAAKKVQNELDECNAKKDPPVSPVPSP